MIYKLYTYEKGLKLIDATSEETDLIDTMSDYIKANNNISFVIKISENKVNMVYKTINSIQQYVDYLEELKEKYNVKRIVK